MEETCGCFLTFFSPDGGGIFEVGAYSRLGACSNKYGGFFYFIHKVYVIALPHPLKVQGNGVIPVQR